ncbi:MAG: LLM class F420-dependent oxidoreductase [Actinomycetota bacterium]
MNPSPNGGGPRLGVTLPLWPLDVRASCEVAREAEGMGYTDVWTAETAGPDGLAMATAVGAVTERMRIGCAVVPVFTRPPPLIAMGALAAHQASAGRFCLGLGASSPTIVDGWMGIPFEAPLVRVKETLEVVRSALSGEKVAYDGTTVRAKGFKLEAAADVPIYLAALGPRMMELAASAADGIALFLASEEGVRIARKAAPELDIVERIICCPGEDVDTVRDAARWLVTPYISVPAYNRFIAAQGFEDEATAVASAWAAGDRSGALDAVSDRLVEALVLMGSAESCKERLDSFRDAGLDTPVLMFFSTQGEEGTRRALRAIAPDS